MSRHFPIANQSAKLSNIVRKPRKWRKLALAVMALLIACQIGVSAVARTRRVHGYFVAHLERAFGRRVEVAQFDMRILPSPRLDANGVTVGEDPAFGYEYFLRAERLSASLRWTGLLQGHFEFGTLSLSRPSLILVRNAEGRWNLERWLPPAKGHSTSEGGFGGNVCAVAAGRVQPALGSGLAGGFFPALARRGLRRARCVCAGRGGKKRHFFRQPFKRCFKWRGR